MCGSKPLSLGELAEKFRTGVFPLSLLEKLNISYDFSRSKTPVKSREDCLNNLELFLQALEARGFCNDKTFLTCLYQGKSQTCWEIIEYIFSSIYLPEVFEFYEELFAWFSVSNQCEITYPDILVLFKDGSLILRSISEFSQQLKFVEFPETKEEILENLEALEKTLKRHKINFLFTTEEFFLNEYPDCLYVQLWLIFSHFEGRENKTLTKSSTESSSKNSFFVLDSSVSGDSKVGLDLVEKKIIQEERKLMYLSDLRTKAEMKKITPVLSVKEIPHSASQPVLSNTELLICYLLTPKIIHASIESKILKVLINFIPNKNKFSLKSESFLLELKELNFMNTLFLCEIEEIEKFNCKNKEIVIFVRKKNIRLIFKDFDETLKHVNGFEYLLTKLGQKN
jgi:hypothetical protein